MGRTPRGLSVVLTSYCPGAGFERAADGGMNRLVPVRGRWYKCTIEQETMDQKAGL